MRFLWRTDVHFSDLTPRGRADNWIEAVSDKLHHVGDLAQLYRVRAVLDGGDFFNDKIPQRNSHNLVRMVAEIHKRYPCPVLANIGNHDVRYGSVDQLPFGPLGVCFSTGVFERTDGEHQQVLEDPDGTRVRVCAIPYQGARFDPSKWEVQKGREDHLVLMLHQLGTDDPSQGFFPGEDVISYEMLDRLFPHASVVCFGHWHKDQGVCRTAGGIWVVNVGSLTRATLAEDDQTRIPKVVLIELKKNQEPTLQVLPVRHRVAEEVFRKKEEIASRDLLDLEKLIQVAQQVGGGPEGVSVEDQIRNLMGVRSKVKEILLDAAMRSRSG